MFISQSCTPVAIIVGAARVASVCGFSTSHVFYLAVRRLKCGDFVKKPAREAFSTLSRWTNRPCRTLLCRNPHFWQGCPQRGRQIDVQLSTDALYSARRRGAAAVCRQYAVSGARYSQQILGADAVIRLRKA